MHSAVVVELTGHGNLQGDGGRYSGFRRPPATGLYAEDDEAAAAGGAEFWVSALFRPPRMPQGCSGPAVRLLQSTAKRGLRQPRLGPLPTEVSRSLQYDLDAAVVLPGRNDIEVPHQDVGRDRRTSLAADASCRTHERGTSGSQDAGVGAARWSPSSSCRRLQRQWAAVSGRGSRRRRKSRTRKCQGACENSGQVGLAVTRRGRLVSPARRQRRDQAPAGWSGSRTHQQPGKQDAANHVLCQVGVPPPRLAGVEGADNSSNQVGGAYPDADKGARGRSADCKAAGVGDTPSKVSTSARAKGGSREAMAGSASAQRTSKRREQATGGARSAHRSTNVCFGTQELPDHGPLRTPAWLPVEGTGVRTEHAVPRNRKEAASRFECHGWQGDPGGDRLGEQGSAAKGSQ